uniref:Uncharacterized protein n=1 Tax=Siphoviridae sp. ct2hZ16 TaxID=2826276 RepID=A0A8S5QVS4_9CAUD|nr:MAG TPA: hypothetical protein [Siphoviridae sp. ct2hZ16]
MQALRRKRDRDNLTQTGEVGTAYTDREGTRFSSGAKGFWGILAYTNCVGFLCFETACKWTRKAR